MRKIKKFILAKSIGFYINTLGLWSPVKATRIAYRLFCTPRDGKLFEDKLPSVLKNAERETIAVGEAHFQIYKWKGNDTVDLLLHGWESNASRWEKLLPFLQKNGHTIIAIDAPAHGLSDGSEFNVPQYAALIDAVAKIYRPQNIIGHSMGGIASAYHQKHYKNTVEKLVLLGAPSDFSILIRNYVRMLGLNVFIHKQLIGHTKEKFDIALEDFSGAIFLKDDTIQGIIAHDKHDEVVEFSEGRKLADSWKNATFIETKGLGHSMHGDVLYEEISSFLK